MSEIPTPKRARKNTSQVLNALEDYCSTLAPGEQIPTRTELMRLLDASERGVMAALDELRRQGRIQVRNGVGSFVAEPPAIAATETPDVGLDSRTLMAIGAPDRAVFDRAMSLLLPQATAAGLALVCRLIDPSAGSLMLPPPGEKPLGYILFRKDFLPLAKQLQDAGHRVVFVGAPYADVTPEVPVVLGDQEQGGYLVTKHLLDLGHRRLAFRGWSDWPRSRRHSGHQRALAEARRQGLHVQESTVYEGEYEQWRREPELAKAYFRCPDAPTGLIVWNDHEAVALLHLLALAGLRVPQDVSMAGYDNLPEGQEALPPLTTVDGGLEHQLQAALRVLLQPEAPPPTTTVVVVPALISRGSSASPLIG